MKRMTKIAMGVGVLALAGGGMSWAAVPDSDDSEYHACVQNTSSSLKAVYMLDKEAGDCPGGFTEKTWNQVGQTGATGATGPAGDAGPQGPSSMVLEEVTKQVLCSDPNFMVIDLPEGKRGVWASTGGGSTQLTDSGGITSIDDFGDHRSYRLDGEGRIDGVYVQASGAGCPGSVNKTGRVHVLMYDVEE